MNSDTFFTIGSTHNICQDYAIDGDSYKGGLAKDADFKYAIVSDGCSSVPDADFGARLLSKAAAMNMHHFHGDLENFARIAAINAATFCRALALAPDSLCATLLVATVSQETVEEKTNYKFKTLMVGDGAVISKKDNVITLTEYVFPSGAPYYLKYELDRDVKKGYFGQFGKMAEIYICQISADTGELLNSSSSKQNISDQFYFEHNLENCDFVAVASDGLSSFLHHEKGTTGIQNIKVDPQKIVKELLEFKGYQGEFVKRRCGRVLKKWHEINGWHNYDDFGIGVVTSHE